MKARDIDQLQKVSKLDYISALGIRNNSSMDLVSTIYLYGLVRYVLEHQVIVVV